MCIRDSPAAMNGANEALVDLFLKGKIRFIDIQNILEKIIEKHNPAYNLDLEGIMEADLKARAEAYEQAWQDVLHLIIKGYG